MQEHYSKAPITEAVIDLRVTLPEGEDPSALASLKEAFTDRFPTQRNHYQRSGEFKFEEAEATAQGTSEHIGFRLESIDKRKVLVVSMQGFSFSKLRPYENWEALRSEARELWNRYKAACHPLQINRAAVRYINRIDIPLSHKINAYVRLHPSIPIQYPSKELTGFFLQLQIPQRDIESTLVLNEALIEGPDPETASIMLDFDLFRESMWNMEEEEAAWGFLETLRTRKNELFEASITDKTRELIR